MVGPGYVYNPFLGNLPQIDEKFLGLAGEFVPIFSDGLSRQLGPNRPQKAYDPCVNFPRSPPPVVLPPRSKGFPPGVAAPPPAATGYSMPMCFSRPGFLVNFSVRAPLCRLGFKLFKSRKRSQ